jgi:hypothetical protein
LIGGLITLLTTGLQNRHARAERKAEVAAERRKRAAEILGRVRTFLTDIEPVRIGFNVDPNRTPDEMQALAARLNTLRDELSIFAAGADDDRVMARAADLEVALFNAFNRVSWHARELLSHGTRPLDSYNAAQHEHLRASTLSRIVLDLVRRRDVTELEGVLQELDEKKSGAEAARAAAEETSDASS